MSGAFCSIGLSEAARIRFESGIIGNLLDFESDGLQRASVWKPGFHVSDAADADSSGQWHGIKKSPGNRR